MNSGSAPGAHAGATSAVADDDEEEEEDDDADGRGADYWNDSGDDDGIDPSADEEEEEEEEEEEDDGDDDDDDEELAATPAERRRWRELADEPMYVGARFTLRQFCFLAAQQKCVNQQSNASMRGWLRMHSATMPQPNYCPHDLRTVRLVLGVKDHRDFLRCVHPAPNKHVYAALTLFSILLGTCASDRRTGVGLRLAAACSRAWIRRTGPWTFAALHAAPPASLK